MATLFFVGLLLAAVAVILVGVGRSRNWLAPGPEGKSGLLRRQRKRRYH